MKNILSLLSFIFLFVSLFAEKNELDVVTITGIENPVAVAISPDGLKMVTIDLPKKGKPAFKLSNRPYLKSPWSVASNLETINQMIGEDTRVDGPCFSFDNKYLYFAANFSNSKGGMDIYRCEVAATSVSVPENIGEPINSIADENFPSISGNNRTIFFTRAVKIKKLENFNTGELWMSNIDGTTNNWLAPEKINTEINSGGIAYSKIYDDNATVIFSKITDDKEKWEIYWAKRLGDIHWYVPVKMDTLSTSDCEISPSYCAPEQSLYFVRLDVGGFHSKGVIHKQKLTQRFLPDKTIEISGKIFDQLSKLPLEATILVTDPVLGRINFLTLSDKTTGSWKALLNANSTYMFHIWKEGYSHRYKLFTSEETKLPQVFDVGIFPETSLTLNIYDKEAFWPLDGGIVVHDNSGNVVQPKEQFIFKGQKKLTLPIGVNYSITVSVKDYLPNKLELALDNIILFNEFVRDIELIPMKRNLEIYVTDEETKNPLEASIEITDSRKVRFKPEIVKGNQGLYQIGLREGEKFDVEVRGPQGFAFKHLNIDLDSNRDLKRLQVQLKPLKRKVPIRLNNINFEFNSADLLEESHEELNRVIQLIKDNPDIRIEILAHTDDVGSDRFNLVLADKRAKSVVEYMVINGIDNRRLVATGYGESMPLLPNTSDENRAINRRVEMKILDRDEPIYIEVDN